MKRSGKFYRKNEQDVMYQLGLVPTKGSGSGWIEKEDGQSDNIICQLKSTDAQSIKVHKQDLDTLQYNAAVSHKLPVFAIQFIGSNELYLVLKPEVLSEVAEYLKTGEYDASKSMFGFVGVDTSGSENVHPSNDVVVRSSSNARDEFHAERNNKYRKRSKTAL